MRRRITQSGCAYSTHIARGPEPRRAIRRQRDINSANRPTPVRASQRVLCPPRGRWPPRPRPTGAFVGAVPSVDPQRAVLRARRGRLSRRASAEVSPGVIRAAARARSALSSRARAVDVLRSASAAARDRRAPQRPAAGTARAARRRVGQRLGVRRVGRELGDPGVDGDPQSSAASRTRALIEIDRARSASSSQTSVAACRRGPRRTAPAVGSGPARARADRVPGAGSVIAWLQRPSATSSPAP